MFVRKLWSIGNYKNENKSECCSRYFFFNSFLVGSLNRVRKAYSSREGDV